MNSREGQLEKKYMWTWEEGQFKRQVAMQMINKHDSPSSRLINRATSGIGHKWSMNLRMDWECVSLKSLTDHQLDTTASVVMREWVNLSLLHSYRPSRGLLLTAPLSLSSHSFPCHVIYTERAPKCMNAVKSQKGGKKQKKQIQNMITFFVFHNRLRTF